jgi:hypothetical protein
LASFWSVLKRPYKFDFLHKKYIGNYYEVIETINRPPLTGDTTNYIDILRFSILNIPVMAPTDTIVIIIDESTEIYNPADSAAGGEDVVLLCYLTEYVEFPYELGQSIQVTCAYDSATKTYTITIPANTNFRAGAYEISIKKEFYLENIKISIPIIPTYTNFKFTLTTTASTLTNYLKLDIMHTLKEPTIAHTSLSKSELDFIDVSFKYDMEISASAAGNETVLVIELDSYYYQNDLGYV